MYVIQCLMILWLSGGVWSNPGKYENEVCRGNTACTLSVRTKALISNDSCWVCHLLHATPAVHPYRPGNYSPCAAALTPECPDGNCPDGQEGLKDRVLLNKLLTVMSLIWAKDTNQVLDQDQFSRRTAIKDLPEELRSSVTEFPGSLWVWEGPKGDKVYYPATNCTAFVHEGEVLVPEGEHTTQVITVTETPGVVCVRLRGRENKTYQHLGDSDCEVYWNLYHVLMPVENSMFDGILITSNDLVRPFFRLRFADFSLPHGYWWVCGNKAYSRWPRFATGSCYVGAVSPSIAVHPSHSLFKTPRSMGRHKRDLDQVDTYGNHLKHTWLGYDVFNGYVMENPWTARGEGIGLSASLWGGVSASLMKINYLAWALQNVANDTAVSVALVGHDLKLMRTELMSHRLALDILLAEKGGLCHVVNTSCCFLVPDHYENYTHLAEELRGLVPQPPTPTTLDLVFEDWANFLGHVTTGFLMSLVKMFLPFLIPVILLYLGFTLLRVLIACVRSRLAAAKARPQATQFVQLITLKRRA